MASPVLPSLPLFLARAYVFKTLRQFTLAEADREVTGSPVPGSSTAKSMTIRHGRRRLTVSRRASPGEVPCNSSYSTPECIIRHI